MNIFRQTGLFFQKQSPLTRRLLSLSVMPLKTAVAVLVTSFSVPFGRFLPSLYADTLYWKHKIVGMINDRVFETETFFVRHKSSPTDVEEFITIAIDNLNTVPNLRVKAAELIAANRSEVLEAFNQSLTDGQNKLLTLINEARSAVRMLNELALLPPAAPAPVPLLTLVKQAGRWTTEQGRDFGHAVLTGNLSEATGMCWGGVKQLTRVTWHSGAAIVGGLRTGTGKLVRMAVDNPDVSITLAAIAVVVAFVGGLRTTAGINSKSPPRLLDFAGEIEVSTRPYKSKSSLPAWTLFSWSSRELAPTVLRLRFSSNS
jgi:hypothetical protein